MKYLLALFLLVLPFNHVLASVYVWQDPKYDITLTFPDDWVRQAQEGDDMRLHILAPQGTDHAACRVLASNDNRFLYVPPRGAVQVSSFVQDQQAMKNILANRLRYDEVRLTGYQTIASLGKGPASFAVGQFVKAWNGQNINMQSLVFGGYMYGFESVFQCEAMASAWGRWQPVFLDIASTFDYPAKFGILKQGQYRDFMADGFVYFPVGAGNATGKARY